MERKPSCVLGRHSTELHPQVQWSNFTVYLNHMEDFLNITFLNKTREWPSSTTKHAHLEPCLQQASTLPLIDAFILIPKDFCLWCFQTMLALSIKNYILWELYQSWELSGKNSRLARQDFVNCFHSGIKPLASCMLITHFSNRLHTSNPWKNFFFFLRDVRWKEGSRHN